MGLLTTRIEGAGNYGTHGPWDSLESSLTVANPRGAIPNIRQRAWPRPRHCARRARERHARRQANARIHTYHQALAAPARGCEPCGHWAALKKRTTHSHGRRRDAAAPANRCTSFVGAPEHVITTSDEARAHRKSQLFGDGGGLRVRGSDIYNSDRRARAREAVPYDGIGRGFEL